jgi:elongation factor 2
LTRFAQIYSKKFKIDEKKMMEKLWGDNYYDAEGKKWKKNENGDNGKTLKRAFCAFVMEPIIRLARSIMEADYDTMNKMLVGINVELK